MTYLHIPTHFSTELPDMDFSFSTTITIGQFIFADKEVKSRLHYLNEDIMNIEGEFFFYLNHNFLDNIKNFCNKVQF